MIELRRPGRTFWLLLTLVGLAAAGASAASLDTPTTVPVVVTGSGQSTVVLGSAAVEAGMTSSPGTSSPNARLPKPAARSGQDQWYGALGVSVGDVTGLYPGGRVRLPVTISNPTPFAIRVIRFRVRTEGTPSCSGRYFHARHRSLLRPRVIQPRHRKVISVPYRMRLSATDGCQGARVVIRVHVEARTR